MATLYKILILCVGFALSNNLWAQSRLTDCEKHTEHDSIIAEVEKHFGWNDDAYSNKIAKEKWQSGKAKLLLQSGIAPVVYIGQEKFKEEYGVEYDDFGCMMYCSESQMEAYNTIIMDYLTAKFGNKWRNHIRKDVLGLKKYGTEAFNKTPYDNNGIATLTIPVIYIALGKAGDFYGKEPVAIREMIGCEPSTSVEFLYRGVEYYIPLSCNADMKELPTGNELIKLTIKLFNPKKFRYPKSLNPYPFCVIEKINFIR